MSLMFFILKKNHSIVWIESTYFVRIVKNIRYIGEISLEAWYMPTSNEEKIPTTFLFKLRTLLLSYLFKSVPKV